MAYASATKAQKQALRDAIVNATKVVEQAQEFGQPGAASLVDEPLTTLQTALNAVIDAGASAG